ncbi:MAG: hypothetical protein QXQ94_11125 [Candidatus Bathyarchaeia archaeon]
MNEEQWETIVKTATNSQSLPDKSDDVGSKAVEVTGDFEPVFYTGIYDEMSFQTTPLCLRALTPLSRIWSIIGLRI